MASLQPRLHLKVAQRQVLTPGLVQMVSVLALNKLELKEMINAEIVENPILEEMDENVPLLDEVAQAQESPAGEQENKAAEKSDPFEEIDFGTYFQEYMDPGFRTHGSAEVLDLPGFENFVSPAGSLTDHLEWQLGAMNLTPPERAVAEIVVGNLDGDGYLTASHEELLALLQNEALLRGDDPAELLPRMLKVVQTLDPAGVAARDLRECLLAQIAVAKHEAEGQKHAGLANGKNPAGANHGSEPAAASASDNDDPEDSNTACIFTDAQRIVSDHLDLLQKRDLRDLARAMRRPAEALADAVAFIRTLDPRPGRRYNREQARLIEPDVAIIKRDDTYIAALNDDDLPALRLNHGYRRLLTRTGTEPEVRNYIKERYKSAIQLMRNIEQRKTTILRVCDIIIRRQHDFLENGVDALHPMMIKDVAEEIGVHPSTVSRAVANKYVHTPQGVFELRFFFTEAVNGPEGSDTPLMLLKRRVKKIIESEDCNAPLTDDHIAKMLQDSGIHVTRRTVAKYREDLHIPSTHQRRIRKQAEHTI